MAYNGLHDYTFFKKKMYPLFLHIIGMLQLMKKEELSSAFEYNTKKWEADTHEKHKLEHIQRYF